MRRPEPGSARLSQRLPDTTIRCERYLDGCWTRGDDVWPVFSLNKLIGAAEFQKAAA